LQMGMEPGHFTQERARCFVTFHSLFLFHSLLPATISLSIIPTDIFVVNSNNIPGQGNLM
jgi:hypothetical protein